MELSAMQQMLRESLEKERVVSRENLRIRQALDTVSNATMIANSEGKIIYMNRSAYKLMRASEQNLRQFFPEFSADQIVGQSMDIFHKNPNHQRDLLAGMKETHKSEIPVGEQIFLIESQLRY